MPAVVVQAVKVKRRTDGPDCRWRSMSPDTVVGPRAISVHFTGRYRRAIDGRTITEPFTDTVITCVMISSCASHVSGERFRFPSTVVQAPCVATASFVIGRSITRCLRRCRWNRNASRLYPKRRSTRIDVSMSPRRCHLTPSWSSLFVTSTGRYRRDIDGRNIIRAFTDHRNTCRMIRLRIRPRPVNVSVPSDRCSTLASHSASLLKSCKSIHSCSSMLMNRKCQPCIAS